MNGDAEAIGQAIHAEMPAVGRLLGEMGATLVSEERAKAIGLLGPDESYAPSVPQIDEIRRKLVITLKELGKLQTGQPVPLRWCDDAARLIAEAHTGECDFDLLSEPYAPSLIAVLEAAEACLKAELKKAPADPDIPF